MDDAIMADVQGIDPELVESLIELGRDESHNRIIALEAERDAKDHECHRLRNVLNDRNEDLTAAEGRAVIAERERDEWKEKHDALFELLSPPKDFPIEGWSQIPPHWMAYINRLEAWYREAKAERDAARQAAAALRKWGATWRSIAWGYEVAWGENVQIFDNKQQLWASCRPRDCMGRRVDE